MKTSTLLTLLGLAGGVTIFSSCSMHCVHGSHNSATETHKMGDFNRIHISGSFKVNLKQDSSMTVTVTADDNLMKYIKVENQGSELHVYTRKNICDAGDMTLNIGVRKLEELKASGAVELISNGKLNTGDLNIDLSGACKADLELNAGNVTTGGSGSTEVQLKGQATSNHIDMSGEGKVHALDFVVSSCNIETSGASECEVNALKTLEVHTSGASEIKYRGNPSISEEKSGASSITKVD